MPAISSFPGCCGASIISGFAGNPEAGAVFETELVDTRWGPSYVPKLDKNGKRIVKKSFAQQFIEQITENKQGGDHAYFAILNENQMNTSWPQIFHDCGFKFIGQWNNTTHNRSPNYLFLLPKHESMYEIPDFDKPPPQWLKVLDKASATPEPTSKAA